MNPVVRFCLSSEVSISQLHKALRTTVKLQLFKTSSSSTITIGHLPSNNCNSLTRWLRTPPASMLWSIIAVLKRQKIRRRIQTQLAFTHQLKKEEQRLIKYPTMRSRQVVTHRRRNLVIIPLIITDSNTRKIAWSHPWGPNPQRLVQEQKDARRLRS